MIFKEIFMKNMKKVNFFIIALFSLFSFVFAQYDQKKWYIRIGYNDMNYYPMDNPFKCFLQKKNHNVNSLVPNIELGHNINPNIGLYLEGTLGMVDNERWKIKESFFLKLGPGINFHFFPKYWLDPYMRLGGGYHQFDYSNKTLTVSDSKYYKLNRKNFFLLDGGFGMNFWIVSNLGLNLQSTYNQVVPSPYFLTEKANFWKNTIGLAFRFGENYLSDNDENQTVEIQDKENSYFPEEEKKPLETEISKKEDLDNDGILDKEDSCPDKFGLKKFKGCPDTDSDNIPDSEDLCPKKYGSKENNGCPDQIVFKPILFNFGKFTLSPSSLVIIDEIYEIMMKKLPNDKFYINGYTDSYGKSSYNKVLSLKRANYVFKILVSKGVDPSRMEVRGLGKKKGRRVEITIKK